MRTVRTFIMIGSLLLLVVAALVAPAEAQAPAARTQWKMQSSWPAGDFHQVNPKGLVEKIGEMTGGRLQVDLQPAGAVVQAFEVLDAVSRAVCWTPATPGRGSGPASTRRRRSSAVRPAGRTA